MSRKKKKKKRAVLTRVLRNQVSHQIPLINRQDRMGKYGEVYRGYVTLHKNVHFVTAVQPLLFKGVFSGSSKIKSHEIRVSV